jgi:hypothetical protein
VVREGVVLSKLGEALFEFVGLVAHYRVISIFATATSHFEDVEGVPKATLWDFVSPGELG